jgi:FAD/FMN-containing dehydrogenase
MLAENSAGPRSYKYGTIKNWVLGLEVITSSVGRVWIGSRTKKWVSAYNLVSLIVGSEGTLGIITKALLRVAPKPQYRIGISISINNLENAGEIIVALTKLNIDISAIELMDNITIAAINKVYNAGLPESDAIILLEVEAFSSNDMDNKLEALASYLKNLGIPDENVHVYYNADEMWSKRKLAGESLEKVYGGRLDEDVIVPVSLLPKTIMEIKSLSSKFNVNIAVFGHAGDGHLHPSILVPKEKSLTLEIEKIKENIFKIAVKNNGALSGEHGIGIAKKQYLPLEIDANTLKLLSMIKQTIDPHNIMNPGKKI